jgi:hypothetical protein
MIVVRRSNRDTDARPEHQRHGVWVPACAGTTQNVFRRVANFRFKFQTAPSCRHSGARLLQARTRNPEMLCAITSRFRVRRIGRALRGPIATPRNDGGVGAFSRRNASEVCQSLANPSEGGWSGGRRQGCCVRHPLEADQWTHLARQGNRACPRQGAAPPSAPPGHRPVDRSGAPRSGQLSLCPLKDRL